MFASKKVERQLELVFPVVIKAEYETRKRHDAGFPPAAEKLTIPIHLIKALVDRCKARGSIQAYNQPETACLRCKLNQVRVLKDGGADLGDPPDTPAS